MKPEGALTVRPSGTPPFWPVNKTIWWHYRRPDWLPGDPEALSPMRVVQDDERGLACWLAPGSPVLLAARADGRYMRDGPTHDLFKVPRVQARDTWRGPGVLRVAPTGCPWSVWLFRDDAGEFLGWYVNLEAPHLRDEENVYSEDHILDVMVQPSHECVRKDADELALAVQQGRLSQQQADAITSAADAVEAIVAEWGSPFCDGWEQWSEEPDWRPLDLPKRAKWDVDFSTR